MLASPAQGSANHTGNEPALTAVAGFDSDLVTVSAEKIFQRVNAIAETLDALEAELSSGSEVSDRLDALLDRLHGALPAHSSAPVAHVGPVDDSLQAVRNGLEDLLRVIQGEPVVDQPLDLDAVLREVSIECDAESRDSQSDDVHDSHAAHTYQRLDQVLAQVEPLEAQVHGAIAEQATITAQMTRELSRLVAFSQSLTRRATELDSRSAELTEQWDHLHSEREELSVQRERISHERFELSLRREALDAETHDLQLAYEQLATRLDQPQPQPVCEDFPPRVVSEYLWSGNDEPSTPAPSATSKSASSATQPESSESPAVSAEVDKDEAASRTPDQQEESEFHAERKKLRALLASFEDDEELEAHDENNAVGAGVGQAVMLGHNSVENGLRSRDEAIRQLDEMLLSYASADSPGPSNSGPSNSATSSSTADTADASHEATFDFDSGDSLFQNTNFEEEEYLEEDNEPLASPAPVHDPSLAAEEALAALDELRNELDRPSLFSRTDDAPIEPSQEDDVAFRERLEAEAIHEEQAVEAVADSPEDELNSAIARLSQLGLTPASRPAQPEVSDLAAQSSIEATGADDLSKADHIGGSSIPLFGKKDSIPTLESPSAPTDSSPTSEDGKLINLRSQLAEMFGIDPSKRAEAEASEAKPLDERFQSFYTGGRPVDEVDLSSNSSIPTEDSDIQEEEQHREPSRVETSTRSVPAMSSAREEESQDPIKAYMDQLIARNRRQNSHMDDVAAAKTAEAAPTTTSEGSSQESSVSDTSTESVVDKPKNDMSWLSEDPTHKQDKEAARAHLKTLRDLANSSARTAVVRASKRQLKMQVLTKTVATLMSLTFGAISFAVELPSIYGYSVIGLGLIFATDLLIVIVRNWMKSSEQTRLQQQKHSPAPEPQPVAADPHTEDRLANFARAESGAKH